MVRQFLYLDEWDWEIIVYYDAGIYNAEEILWNLRRLGCSNDSLERAEGNLGGPMLDTGLTYTNNLVRSSVIVISESSCPEEFWSTLDHEKGHVSKHIAEALGIDCNGEEIQYLSGEIARKMYPVARHFIR